jgi:hypothetical protein
MNGEGAFLRRSHPMDRTRLVDTRDTGAVAHVARGRCLVAEERSPQRGCRCHGAPSDPRSGGSYWTSP